MLISIEGLNKSFGEEQILYDINLSIEEKREQIHILEEKANIIRQKLRQYPKEIVGKVLV